ncbi:MAG: hypothetical protein ACTSPB_01490 [Candidatus Thorarchaeota archaeon]
MPRYGTAYMEVKRIILKKEPRKRFKASDLVPLLEKRLGYDVNSKRVGQCLRRLRDSGLVRKIPVTGESCDWELVEAVMQ